MLLKDFCGRSPYDIKALCEDEIVFVKACIDDNVYVKFDGASIIVDRFVDEVKPYLFPLSSMTEEQLYELRELFGFEIEFFNGFIKLSSRSTLEYLEMVAIVEWFYKNHFDINGLIPMGLALDATNLNIY